MARKRSTPESVITSYFEAAPLPVADAIYNVVGDILRRRKGPEESTRKRGPGRPKKATEPEAAS